MSGSTAIAAALAIASALAAQSASRPANVVRSRDVGVMGTSLKIEVEGPTAAELDAALDAAVAEFQRIEDLMTDWRTSPLTKLVDAAGQGPQKVPPELAAIVARSVEVSKYTGDAFDPTYAAVGALWDFKTQSPAVPSAAAISAALRHVGARQVEVDPKTSTVDLPAGTRIGLGGIAKGYAVDRAMSLLRQRGIRNATVNAGGDLKVLGQLRGAPWEIALKHPRYPDHAIAVLRVSNTCVVTSGDYERFFEIDGKRYHHIIDPRDGYPSRGCISATVVGPSAEFADALATALCVLGPTEGLALIERTRRYEAIVIGLDEKVRATEKLQPSLTDFDSGQRK